MKNRKGALSWGEEERSIPKVREKITIRMCEEAIRDHFFIHLKIIYNTYMYMYIHREVKRSYAIWVDNATLNNHKTNKKIQYHM